MTFTEPTREQEYAADEMALRYGRVTAEMEGEVYRVSAMTEVPSPHSRGGTRVETVVHHFNEDGKAVRA